MFLCFDLNWRENQLIFVDSDVVDLLNMQQKLKVYRVN